MEMRDMKLEDLTPAEYNPRLDLKPGEPMYESIRRSVDEFGLVEPIVWNERSDHIVGGHQRYKVLQELGYSEVPVAVVDLDEAQEKQLNIALNNIGGAFDYSKLADVMLDLDQMNADLTLTGFDNDEIEDIMNWSPEMPEENDGEGEETEPAGSLYDKFIVPPFSILDTRQGYWQNRKEAWSNVGIKSELGRQDDLTWASDSGGDPDYYNKKKKKEKELGRELTTEEFQNEHYEKTSRSKTSIFDPVLCELAYRWFAPDNGNILDPFAGGSVRGIVAGKLGHPYVGVDLRAEQVEANRQQGDEIETEVTPTWFDGDSKNVKQLVGDYKADMVFSCPPYADLEVYSDDPADISNMDYDSFLKTYREIISESVNMLKDDRFACFVVSEVRDKKGFYRNFVPDTIQAFEDAGMRFYNEMILINTAGSLPIRVGRQFSSGRKVGRTHQNVLVFYKGDPKKIKEKFGEVNVEDILAEHDVEYGEEL